MSDRELLEMAAKAAGLRINFHPCASYSWNPLTNDGDALRLAVKLRLLMNREINMDHDIVEVFGPERDDFSRHCSTEGIGTDPYAATRRAIVRAAAEIGKAMP